LDPKSGLIFLSLYTIKRLDEKVCEHFGYSSIDELLNDFANLLSLTRERYGKLLLTFEGSQESNDAGENCIKTFNKIIPDLDKIPDQKLAEQLVSFLIEPNYHLKDIGELLEILQYEIEPEIIKQEFEDKPNNQYPKNFPLTPEQRKVMETDYRLPQLVLAPPGTGKTHVVIARICHLIEKQGVKPWELLVLCFTRVAVREIKNRLGEMVRHESVHDDVRFVDVRTFDSYATSLLLEANEEADLSNYGFDERIALATDELTNKKSPVQKRIGNYKHLIIDEVQDIVGVRAKFVQQLIVNVKGGYTILGDPAQAIYDFSLKDKKERITSEQLLQYIRKQAWLISDEIEVELTSYHRYENETAQIATDLRKTILGENAEERALIELKSLIEGLESEGSGRSPENLRPNNKDNVCILCRNNGEILQLSYLLSENNIPFCIKPRIQDHGIPAWVGRVLGTYQNNKMSRNEFEDRWKDIIGNHSNVPEVSKAWDILNRIDSSDNWDLNIGKLRNKFLQGTSFPDEEDAFFVHQPGTILLSTIHASKGREFDKVVVLNSDSNHHKGSSNIEEARILYVAATRAKKELKKLERSGIPSMWVETCCQNRKRWMASFFANGKRFEHIEVGLPSDIGPEASVNQWLIASDTKCENIQNLLWENVAPGQSVRIEKVYHRKMPFFDIILPQEGYDNVTISQMSLNFKYDLAHVLKKKSEKFRYPKQMGKIQISTVETKIIPRTANTVHFPYSQSGFCLGIRIRGLGYLRHS
jgi:ATP-dependent DNA helicase UvrD/PcrA